MADFSEDTFAAIEQATAEQGEVKEFVDPAKESKGFQVMEPDTPESVEAAEDIVAAEDDSTTTEEASPNVEADDSTTTTTTTSEEEEEVAEVEEEFEQLKGYDLVQHLRKVAKDKGKELREKDAQISQLQIDIEAAAPTQASTPTPTHTPAAAAAAVDRIPPADIFKGLVEVRAGDRQESDMAIIQANIDQMSIKDLQSVMDVAKSRGFGDMSADILTAVREHVPDVMIREKDRASEHSTKSEWNKARNKAWEAVQSIPGMADHTSQIYKDFVRAEQDVIQDFPNAKLQADAPIKVLERMELNKKASAVTKLSKALAENAELRKQLNLGQGGLDSKGSVAPTKGDSSAEISIEDQFLIDAGLA